MILVTGATGTVGSEVLKQLVEAGHAVRVVARDPGKFKDAGAGVEVVRGDLSKPETLDAAFAGVDKAFVMGTGPNLEEPVGNAVDAAKKAGVRHIVFLSSGLTGMPHLKLGQWHLAAEEKIKASGMEWTMLRPGSFSSNTLMWAGSIKAKGAVFAPLGAAKTTPIDPADIAAMAVAALTSPGHEGKAYPMSGSQPVSAAEQIQKISEAIGKPIQLVEVPPEAARQGMLSAGTPAAMVDAVVELFALSRGGGEPVVTTSIQEVLGRPARTFDEWLRDHADAFKGAS